MSDERTPNHASEPLATTEYGAATVHHRGPSPVAVAAGERVRDGEGRWEAPLRPLVGSRE